MSGHGAKFGRKREEAIAARLSNVEDAREHREAMQVFDYERLAWSILEFGEEHLPRPDLGIRPEKKKLAQPLHL